MRGGVFRAFVVCALSSVVLPGCGGHLPSERELDKPVHYTENALPFQPKRVWRLHVRWEPYWLDYDKAMITKEYQLVVHDERERRRLQAEIDAHGGDARYLRWFESELFPFGNWEKKREARVARYESLMVVMITTQAFKEVPRRGYLSVRPVAFPDPLFRAVRDGCHALNWDVLGIGDSVGAEIILESRSDAPIAERWEPVSRDSRTFSWKAWSVGEGKRISYRILIDVKSNIARCPLPPRVHEEYQQIARFTDGAAKMGIEW